MSLNVLKLDADHARELLCLLEAIFEVHEQQGLLDRSDVGLFLESDSDGNTTSVGHALLPKSLSGSSTGK